MALFGLLGGSEADPYDLYGDILTAKQREALRARSSDQTWANTANFLAKAAMPTNKKIPLGGLLAGLAGAMGGSNQDEAVGTALKGAQTTAQIAKLRREQKFLDELSPYLSEAIKRQFGGRGGGVPAPAGVPAVPPTAGAPTPGGFPPPPAAVPLDADLLPYAKGPPAQPGGGDFPGIAGPGASAGSAALNPADLQGLLALAGSGGGMDTGIWSQLASLYGQGGGGGSGAPFDLASLGQGQGLPDLGPVQVELLSGEAAPARGDPRGLVPYIRQRAEALGIDPNVAVRVAQSEGLGSFQSNVIQRSGQREPSYGAFQLYTGGGMGNDFRRDTGLDPSDPKNELKTIDYALENAVRTGWTPWHGARGAGIGPRTGLPGGPAAGTQMAGGLPDVGRVRIDPLGGEATPAGQAGLVPGLGVTPEALALMNAMAKLGGIDSPFGSLLETYYKSPGYLEEKARTEEVARKKIGLEYDPLIAAQTETAKAKVELEHKPKIEEAVQKLQSPILKEREQAKADIERVSKELEQNRQAGVTPVDVTVVGSDGQLADQKITASEFARRQQAKAERFVKGDTRTLPGDIVGKPTGNLPPGYQHRITPEGKIEAGPVPNTPAAREEAEAVEKKRLEAAQKQTATDFVVTDIDRIREKVKASPFTTTGVVGGWLSGINQTDAGFIKNAVEGIEANILLDRMLALKAASPTGASGLGSLTEQEGQRLVKAYGSLKNSQDTADFLYNLDRVQRLYLELVHGPVAAQQMMANRPEVAGPGAARPAASPAASPALTQQMRTEAMQAIGKGAPRDKVLQRLREMGVDTGGL